MLKTVPLVFCLVSASLGVASCITPATRPEEIRVKNAKAGENLRLADLAASLPDQPIVAGFDLDDTLYSSSFAFRKSLEEWKRNGYSGDLRDAMHAESFWFLFNNRYGSAHKKKPIAAKLIHLHKNRGDKIVVITARGSSQEESMTDQVAKDFNLTLYSPASGPGNFQQIIFTNLKKKAKAAYISTHNISVYYGDSDSDIAAAKEAGARGIRVLRGPESDYLADYNPGSYQEEIVSDQTNS